MAVDKLIWKIALDFLVLACEFYVFQWLSLLALLLWAEPYHRGYFENDESLRLPYKKQQISEGLLAGLGFAFIVVTVVLIEVVRDKQGKGIGEKFVWGALVAGWAWESYVALGVFTFGAACQQLFVNSAKYVIGRLRPHFIDVCRPIVDRSSSLNELGYIQDYTCEEPDSPAIKEMRLSFPSAHASFAMYTAVFFIFYLQTKGKWRGSKLLRHGCQFAALMAAWYVGLSRVTDHMHHWGDVAVGFAVGTVCAIIVFVYVLKPKKYGMPRSWETAPPDMLPQPVMSR